MTTLDQAKNAADIVRDAGGRVVGRTRLQKIAFLLEASGLGSGFHFQYKHFGPYSEQLASASKVAALLDLISESEQIAAWGGSYSIFSLPAGAPSVSVSHAKRRELAERSARADAVELELAATAIFLALENDPHPWTETARRKPDKAENGRLEKAKKLYAELRQINTPKQLPALSE